MAQVTALKLPLSPTSRIPLLELDRNIVHLNQETTEKPANNNSTAVKITPSLDLNATHIISSPYSSLINQLHLPSLPLEARLLALSLTALKTTRPDYATAPYLASFNWSEVFALLRSLCAQSNHNWQSSEWYVVIFRSKLQESADRERLGLLDQMSHQEACASGGLLKYWFGETDGERRNLATCELPNLSMLCLFRC
jgi:hypothetical protein